MQAKHWVLIGLVTLLLVAFILIWLYASQQRSRAMLEHQRAVQQDVMIEYQREIERLHGELEKLRDEREKAGAL